MKIYILIIFSLILSSMSVASNYGIQLSDEEKLVALTEYFMKKDLKLKAISLPPKPKKPTVPKAKIIKKSKYEKMQTYEQRVKTEEDTYLKKVQNIEKQYQQSLEKYDINIEKITKSYNYKNGLRKKKIEKRAKEKAYSSVYGNPYITNLDYDAEKESFNAELKSTKSDYTKAIVINVHLKEAEEFEKNIKRMRIKVSFEPKDNSQKIKYISIKSSKHTYIAKLK